MKKNKLLVINACQGKKNFIFERLYSLWYEVLVLNKERDVGIEKFVTTWILEDTMNIDKSFQKIISFVQNNKINWIITFWEDDVLLTSKLIEYLNLPWIPYFVAKNIRNKYLFRETSARLNINTPNFILLQPETTEASLQHLKFPCVLKPAYGASSAYIIKCNSHLETIQNYKTILNLLSEDTESALHDWHDLFVEEFIPWNEIDIDVLIQNWDVRFMSITDNIELNEQFFQEKGQSGPSKLSQNNQKLIKEQAKEILKKLWINNWCLHFEAKFNHEQLIPIEINLRMWGDEVWYFNKEIYWIDLIDFSAKIACGVEIPVLLDAQPTCFLVWEYLLPHKPWVISEIFIDKCRLKKLWVLKYEICSKIGSRINLPPNGYDFFGWYILKSYKSEIDRGLIQEIRNCFNFLILSEHD